MAIHKKNASQTNASVQTARLILAVPAKSTEKMIVLAANQDFTWKTVIATENKTYANARMGRLELALTVENTEKQTVLAVIQDFTYRG